jgi:GT2 family glycosyltransferase/SAM-dependent methyltransferase
LSRKAETVLLNNQDRSQALAFTADLPYYYTFSRPEILALVPWESRNVLELGCASGRLGRSLKERQICRLTGVEMNPQAAQEARKYFDWVISENLESGSVQFPEHTFDAVICADVLEHLQNPWLVLKSISQWLRPGGILICSIPNIANLGIMTQLAKGLWSYADAGILDRTHLRFFTRSGFEAALTEADFQIDVAACVKDLQFQSASFPADSPAITLNLDRISIRDVTRKEFEEFTAVQFLFKSHKPAAASIESNQAEEHAVPALASAAKAPRPVSIIIAVHNQAGITKACLESILKNTPGDLFDLILVDNASSDATPEFLKCLSGDVQVVTLDKNQGAAEGWNQGAARAQTKYLVFLHNDAFVQAGWLPALLAMMENDDRIAAASPRIIGPDGRLQAAGRLIFADGACWDYGLGDDPHRSCFSQPIETDAFSGVCALVRRDAFQKAGGFDPQFSPVYFEDADLSFTLRRLAFKVMYCPDAWVAHFPGQTSKTVLANTPTLRRTLQGRFHQKWRQALDQQGLCPQSLNTMPVSADRRIRLAENQSQLAPPASARALASLVILAYNQRDYTVLCLESILACTSSAYEVIVVDNASTDDTLLELEKFRSRFAVAPCCQGFKILHSHCNLGFAGGNNLGMAESSGDYILLLNNDIVVTPGWLERLIAGADHSPKTGLVGPMSNFTSGPQLVPEPGYNPVTLAGLDEYGLRFSQQHAGARRRLWRIVGFCLLLKRDVLLKIGGLDPRFGLGNFEDDDFCLRALLAGFESWIIEDCFVHHYGSRTFVGENIDYRQSLQKNWDIFKAKWNIPANVAYGSFYNFDAILEKGFSSDHYCPLPAKSGDFVPGKG